MSDPADYRVPREEKLWKDRDPIPFFARKLIEEGIAEAEDLRVIKEEIEQEVEEAVRFADESPWPEDRELSTDIYSEQEADE